MTHSDRMIFISGGGIIQVKVLTISSLSQGEKSRLNKILNT